MQRTAKDAADAARNMSGMARTAQETSRGMDAAALSAKRFRDGAQDAARLIASMRNNMQGVQRTIRDAAGQMQGLGRGAATAMRGAAALGTAGYVAKAALDKPVSFESKSLDAANTIYGDIAPGERIKKASQLRAQAFEAARKYGGGADQAMEIIQGLAAGGLDGDSIDRLLPTALKTVVAGKLQSKDVTNLLLKGLKNKMFTLDQADLAMDEGLKGGKQGSFEFKDMAKYLPQFAALGTGMKSHAGYQMHIANAEAIETVSADPDQAGNNYINLLQKLNAPDVKNNFKKKGINLTKVQLQAASKGIDPVTAMADAVESLMHKSKGYQKLKKKLAVAQNDDERRQIAEQMVDIMQGSQLAQLIPDRQALTGLVGITSQKAYRDEVLAGVRAAAGTVEADHNVIASGTEFKEQQLATEKDYAASKTHDTVKPWLDKGLDTVTDFARENPAATTAAYAGGTGATAAAGVGAANALLGGGSVVQGAAKGLFAGAEATAKASPLLMLGGAMYKVHQTATDASLTTAEKNINNMETYGQFGGALSGNGRCCRVSGAAPGQYCGWHTWRHHGVLCRRQSWQGRG